MDADGSTEPPVLADKVSEDDSTTQDPGVVTPEIQWSGLRR